jgi:hypothetical protein
MVENDADSVLSQRITDQSRKIFHLATPGGSALVVLRSSEVCPKQAGKRSPLVSV